MIAWYERQDGHETCNMEENERDRPRLSGDAHSVKNHVCKTDSVELDEGKETCNSSKC